MGCVPGQGLLHLCLLSQVILAVSTILINDTSSPSPGIESLTSPANATHLVGDISDPFWVQVPHEQLAVRYYNYQEESPVDWFKLRGFLARAFAELRAQMNAAMRTLDDTLEGGVFLFEEQHRHVSVLFHVMDDDRGRPTLSYRMVFAMLRATSTWAGHWVEGLDPPSCFLELWLEPRRSYPIARGRLNAVPIPGLGPSNTSIVTV